MYNFNRAMQSKRDQLFALPSDDLHVAVTFKRRNGGDGPTKFNPPMSLSSVAEFKPDPLLVDRAVYHLAQLGFRPTRRGAMSVSMRVSREVFERTFGTKLETVTLDPKVDAAFRSFFFPPDNALWVMPTPLSELIDDAYIQWPHIYMGTRRRPAGLADKPKPTQQRKRRAAGVAAAAGAALSAQPPNVPGYHLDVPDGVAGLLNVADVHRAGATGKGVRVAMVDTGFQHSHPYFVGRGYKSTVDLAPHATNDATDVNGHGTGESANLFAIAPDITFIGVKLDNDSDPRNGASVLEGFQQALSHDPKIISLSLGYDLRASDGTQMAELPNNLAALEAEIQAAVAKGIIVVFSAGNGHFSFPGMMPDVISAGGVFVDAGGAMHASDYASAFRSKIYPGRFVPDFCGLVGLRPHADYIMLPLPPGCELDHETARPDDGLPGDGTAPDDGWGVFSGTSAAAPQLAGVCALLLQKNPSLTPSDIKAILRRSARSVAVGAANPSSSDNGIGEPASDGDTGAAGAGLVDAMAAWQQI